jgi:mannose-6-phosphate isomerase-like protein (cupin superfamily)
MSYNPDRHGPNRQPVKRKALAPPPGSGVRHSTIVSKQGLQAVTISDVRNKVNTPRGWKVQQFRGPDFEVVYEFICARNSTGLIKNEDADRSIRVLAGRLFVTVDKEIIELRSGMSISVARDKEYEMATSGDTDAEVILCQGPEYEDGIEVIAATAAVNAVSQAIFAEANPQAAPRSMRSSKAEAQAQILLAQRRARQARRRPNQQVPQPGASPGQIAAANAPVTRTPPPQRAPLPGQAVTGVNPMPVGAGGYTE